MGLLYGAHAAALETKLDVVEAFLTWHEWVGYILLPKLLPNGWGGEHCMSKEVCQEQMQWREGSQAVWVWCMTGALDNAEVLKYAAAELIRYGQLQKRGAFEMPSLILMGLL